MSVPPEGEQFRKTQVGQSIVDRGCETITAGVLVFGKDGYITYANKAACKILGLLRAGLVGQLSPCPGWEATREDGSPLPRAEHPAMIALATGAPVYGRVLGLRSPAGLSRWLLVDSEPVFDKNTAALEEAVTTFVDVTPLKDPQAALREGEQRFRGLVETTSDWVWEVDEDFVYTYASPRVRDILGYEPEEVLGKRPWDLMPTEEAERISVLAAGARESRAPFKTLENINLHKSGRLVVLETSGTPFFDALGRFRGYRGIDRDISDRKQAEDSLRASEAFLRSVTDLVPSRIAYVDRDQRYRFVNSRYEEWLGCRREEIIGRNLKEVLGDSLDEMIRPYVQAVLSGREVRYELDVEVGEGARRHLSIVYVPHFGKDGEILGFFASLDDVTERKRLEERLRQSQKMEAVGVLAGGIAHDFNNLLTVIIGYSQSALAQLDPHEPLSRDIDEIAQAGARAASLTQQLLAFSRKQLLQPKVLNLNALVAGLETMLRRLIEERIELRIDLDPSLARIKADPAQVEQIMMNLVVNARDAMPDGGRLTIETRNVRLDAANSGGPAGAQPGDYVMLAVSDTGRGMDAATQARIFEPFFTTKAVGRGTGLGLATTYGIVKQSGGHISVESEPGRGTRLKIYLPAVEAVAEAMQPAGPAAEARAGTETVLLVEDEPALRRMVCQALSQRGYMVLEASDGEVALQIAEQHHGVIHLLLTDVVMPRLGGPKLAKRLLQRRPEMKVLYISGYSETAIADQGLPSLQADFLPKPFAADDLVQKVGKLLGRPSPPPR
jgi:PAS domain S-box-containing protein